MKLKGGLLVVTLLLGACHYAPDREPPTAEQQAALVAFNKQQAHDFDVIMDDLEAKMIAAGAYKPDTKVAANGL